MQTRIYKTLEKKNASAERLCPRSPFTNAYTSVESFGEYIWHEPTGKLPGFAPMKHELG